MSTWPTEELRKIAEIDDLRISPFHEDGRTKHRDGAAPNTAMTHIAIQEQLNGKVVEWMEKVTDERYQK